MCMLLVWERVSIVQKFYFFSTYHFYNNDNWYTAVYMPQRKETRTYADRAEYIKLAVAKR